MTELEGTIRVAALMSAALHIAKHFCVDPTLRAELEKMRQECATTSIENFDKDVVNETFVQMQKDDPAFHFFLSEGMDCKHLNEIFSSDMIEEFLDGHAAVRELLRGFSPHLN